MFELSSVISILEAVEALPTKVPLNEVAVIFPVDGLQVIKLHFNGLF
jgi:hypothetical protein